MTGDVFKRRAAAPAHLPARVRVVGQLGASWTVTDAAAFGEAFLLTPAELATAYDAPPEVPAEVDEDALRAPGAEALRRATAGYRAADGPSNAPGDGDAPTPEDIFRAAAE